MDDFMWLNKEEGIFMYKGEVRQINRYNLCDLRDSSLYNGRSREEERSLLVQDIKQHQIWVDGIPERLALRFNLDKIEGKRNLVRHYHKNFSRAKDAISDLKTWVPNRLFADLSEKITIGFNHLNKKKINAKRL